MDKSLSCDMFVSLSHHFAGWDAELKVREQVYVTFEVYLSNLL